MGFFQTVGDVSNHIVNGATFGLFNRGVGLLSGHSGEDVDAFNAARAARLGVVGDVVQGAAQLLPFAKGAQAIQLANRAVRGAGAVAEGTRAAALFGRAAPVLEAAPVLGARARIAASPFKYGAAGVGSAIAANASRGAPEGGTVDNVRRAQPVVVAAPAAAGGTAAPALVLPVAPTGGRSPTGNLMASSDEGYRYAMQVAAAREAANPTAAAPVAAAPAMTPFQQTLQSFGNANGGISLNELAILAQAENQGRPAATRAPRVPTGRDIASAQVIEMADQMFAYQAGEAQRLAATDPARAQTAYESAVRNRLAALQGILGQNPINEAVGVNMRNPDEE